MFRAASRRKGKKGVRRGSIVDGGQFAEVSSAGILRAFRAQP